jgi:hypothetical protein
MSYFMMVVYICAAASCSASNATLTLNRPSIPMTQEQCARVAQGTNNKLSLMILTRALGHPLASGESAVAACVPAP